MRYTLHFWICGACRTRNEASEPTCYCGHRRVERNAQVRESERAVVYEHPSLPRITPARADQPMPEIYAQRGYERREIMNMAAYERETGLINEMTNFLPGNEDAYDAPKKTETPKEVVNMLVDEVRAALASGPITNRETSESFNVSSPL